MKDSMRYIRYPIYNRPLTFIEKIALRTKAFPMRCNVCGSISFAQIENDNFRENCYCGKCRSTNRHRQIAYVLCYGFEQTPSRTFKEFVNKNLALYNTEASGPLHNQLSKMKNYKCSEYFGNSYSSGDVINNVLNEDLMALSFKDGCFDFVVSSDVFEHIPDPVRAHREVYRVLKKGGRHVFTVPFYQTEILDELRASINANHEIVHHKEPIYHLDPLRSEGILVYNIFSIEMLSKLARIGFRTNMYFLYFPFKGILGANGIVFEAIKD
jgi:SAM-dependent methyltransferase